MIDKGVIPITYMFGLELKIFIFEIIWQKMVNYFRFISFVCETLFNPTEKAWNSTGRSLYAKAKIADCL